MRRLWAGVSIARPDNVRRGSSDTCPADDFEACRMNAVYLRRIDPARNMRPFYRLDVQPDLFGGVLLSNNGGASACRGA